MVRTLSIPDEVDAVYVKHDPALPGRAMSRQLARFAAYGPNDRHLVLPPELIAEVEKVAQRTFETPEKLLAWIRSLITVDVEGASLELTPSQRAVLKARSDFFRKPYSEYATDAIKEAIRNGIGG